MKKSAFRGIMRAVLFLVWTAILVPIYFLIFFLNHRLRRAMVRFWHQGVCRIIGFKVNVYGTPSQAQNVLMAGNHVSYLDIPVLASSMDMTFVAKADVADWPLFGFLATIAQTAFIERKPSKARQQKIDLQKRIQTGERLMIFPEGTSSDGSQVLPFKSALFEMVMEDHMRDHTAVQPVTIAFVRDHKGNSLTKLQRDYFAWYGDMTLAPHLWDVFCLKGCEIDVIFHASAMAHDFKNRKELAAWAHGRTESGLQNLLGGESITQEDTETELETVLS